MNVEISEKQLIYILNSLSFLMRCMTYHYQMTNIKSEVKRFFNYDNYVDDYNNIMLLHRWLSTRGNRLIYNISNDIYFKGQEDFLCTEEKDFKILQDLTRYKNTYNKKEIKKKLKNQFIFKNKFYFFRKSIDKLKKVV